MFTNQNQHTGISGQAETHEKAEINILGNYVLMMIIKIILL